MQFFKIPLLLAAITLAFIFESCSSEKKEESLTFQTILIRGRNEGLNITERPYIYRISIPLEWSYKEVDLTTSIADSRLPIAEIHIGEAQGEVLISLHNFPLEKNARTIPPMAQISRWKGQFTSLDHTKSSLIPQSFSGYVGFRFEGAGIIKGRQTTVLGWALQVSPEHFLTLSYPRDELEEEVLKQMRGDVTIKVTGPPKLVEKHKQAIDRFARTFEMVHEIPSALL